MMARMTDTPTGRLALRVHMMPKDTNAFGTIFGGVILSLIDQAGFDEARQHGIHRWVTVAFDAVKFAKPVYTGDVVTLYTNPIKLGTSSIEIEVEVWADRYNAAETTLVTRGQLTMVSVCGEGRPLPWSGDATLQPGDDEA